MERINKFDVIIIGGSYSGLAAAMALGRALKNVLIIDSGKPCNRQTPHSHNFLTRDGSTPSQIAAAAKLQIMRYDTVQFIDDLAIAAQKIENGFKIKVSAGSTFESEKIIFATGIKDEMPNIEGFAECWGISAIHCPYCHGYEVRNVTTGILANGDHGFDFAKLISNWTNNLTLFTNGDHTLSELQKHELEKHHINIVQKQIKSFEHRSGYIEKVHFNDGTSTPLSAMYSPRPFKQHCPLPELLGCQLTDDGYLKIDVSQETTLRGVYACGDNASKMRTVAKAVAMGTAVGMMLSKKMIIENF